MKITTLAAATLATTAALLLGGCVSSGKYEALQKEHAQKVARVTELEAALAAEQQKAAALDAELRAARERMATQLKDQASLEASVKEMELALMELERRKREADARIAEFRGLLDRFKSLIDAGKLRVRIIDGRMVVQMATDILFASGKADLSDEGKAAIQEVTAVLVTIPDRSFQVEGHTDNVPIKNARFPSNWELAAARALTVVKTMTENGLAANRVSGASFGEFKPSVANDTDANKALNRRIEIVVVPDLSSLPGFDELNKMGGEQASL
jgi:chemotaxis protein MotB